MLAPAGGPAVTGGPFNVVVGQRTTISAPGQSGQQGYAFVIIYNQSSSIVEVDGVGGAYFLQPLQADVYSMPPGTAFGNNPTVTPVSSLNTGVIVGTVNATFIPYGTAPLSNAKEPEPPPGFPMPLVPFPGGSQIMASFPGQIISSIGGQPQQKIDSIVVIPQSTQSVTVVVNGFGISPANSGTLVIKGVQTGITYLSTSVNVNTGTTFTVSGPFAPDFELEISVVASFNISDFVTVTVTANAQLTIPTYATFSSGRVIQNTGVSSLVIAAPISGALYLFEWDAMDFLGTAQSVYLLNNPVLAAGSEISEARFGAGQGLPAIQLSGFRTTTGVWVNSDGTGTPSAGCVVRFAFGP